MARMREALKPGLSENELWATLHETNIRLGGEWIETRILSSGERTNPWFQECGDRLIRAGDLVSFDTDLIGPFGYCADISRTYFCGPGKPSEEQRRLYGLALEQIHYNIDKLMRPGLNFREASELAWRIPNAFVKNRYSCVAHGVGLCDEWPKITHIQDREKSAYDGELATRHDHLCGELHGRGGGTGGRQARAAGPHHRQGRAPALDLPLRGSALGVKARSGGGTFAAGRARFLDKLGRFSEDDSTTRTGRGSPRNRR